MNRSRDGVFPLGFVVFIIALCLFNSADKKLKNFFKRINSGLKFLSTAIFDLLPVIWPPSMASALRKANLGELAIQETMTDLALAAPVTTGGVPVRGSQNRPCQLSTAG